MRNIILLLMLACLFTNCKKTKESTASLEGTWDLVNLSGGIIGVDCNYDPGVITWTFDGDKIIVNDNNISTSCMGVGLGTGSYSYSIFESNGGQFLFLDDAEFGGIMLLINELIVDQNNLSTGNGADGFLFRLEK